MPSSTGLSTFSFNGAVIQAVGSCAFQINRQPIDITSLGKLNAFFLDGVQTSSAELDMFYSATDHAALTTNLQQVQGDVPVVITWGTGDVLTGCARVVKFALVAAANDVVRCQVSLVFDGIVKLNTIYTYPGTNETASTLSCS